MSFLAPKNNLPASLQDQTPGRQSTQSPNEILPLAFGRARLAWRPVTPVLQWNFRNTKSSSFAFFSGYGWIALGPVDEIVSVYVGGKGYQGIFAFRADHLGDYYDYVRAGETPTTFRFYWGLETAAHDSTWLDGLIKNAAHPMKGKRHPAYRGIFAMAVKDMEAGRADDGMTPPVPDIQVEFSRRSPTSYSFGYAAHGTHPIGVVKDVLTLQRGGLGLPSTYFDATHWADAQQRVMDVGVSGLKGTDLFISPVFAEGRSAGEQCASVLEYLGGHLRERDGKLQVDWSPADGSTTATAGLREVTAHMLVGDPQFDPIETSTLPTRLQVNCLNWSADPPLSEDSAMAPVPYVRRLVGEERPPEVLNRRFFTTTWQAKLYGDARAALVIALGEKIAFTVLRQYSTHPDGVTPLRPGDRVWLNWAPGNFNAVLRITERSGETPEKVSFRAEIEPGAFVAPYEPTIDPRISITQPPPNDLARYAVVQLPPDLSDAGDTLVAPLVERSDPYLTGFQVQFSPTNSWPGQTIESGATRFAVGAVWGTTLASGYADTTVSVGTVGADWIYLASQNVLEQGDDQLLLWHAGEWLSVGAITPTGGGNYSLAVKRARLGSLPVAHSTGGLCFVQYRRELVALQHADFANVESGGVYDVTTATKYFKLRPYNAAAQGNLTAAFSTVLRDPTPAAPTGLAVAAPGGALLIVSWTQPAGALVNEWKVFRATGPGYADEAEIAEVGELQYPDAAVVVGTTYRYRLKAVTTDENVSAFSSSATGTPTAPSTAVDSTPPSNPAAPTLVGTGTYLTDDGVTLVYVDLSIAALPSGARWQNVLLRKTGATNDWKVVALLVNTGTATVRIDDLASGVNYDVAVRAHSSFGVASAVVTATGIPYGATDSVAPAAPTGISALAGTGKSVKVGWAANTEADLAEYAVWRHTSNSPGAATKIAEVTATYYHDNNVALGTEYWYWVTAIDRSENESAKSLGAAATPTLVPGSQVDNTAPSNPGAVSVSSSGHYLAGDGTVLAFVEFQIPAMPAGAAIQNLVYRRVGGSEFMIAAQVRNTGTAYAKVDDLTPGVAYEVGLQAFSFSGAGTGVIIGSGSPYTAPNKGTTPSGVASLSFSNDNIPLAFIPSTEVRYYGFRISWTPPADKDFDSVEIKVTNTDSDGATDYTVTVSPLRTKERQVVLFSPTVSTGFYVRSRTYDKTGNVSGWTSHGNANTYLRQSGGDLAEMNASNLKKPLNVKGNGTDPSLEVKATGQVKIHTELQDSNDQRILSTRKAAVADAPTDAPNDAPTDANESHSLSGSDSVDLFTLEAALNDIGTRLNAIAENLNTTATKANATGGRTNDIKGRLKATGGHGLIAD